MLPLGSKRQQGGKLLESSSEETLLPLDQLSPASNPQTSKKFRPAFNITSRTVQSSYLCAERTMHISISCVNCGFQGKENQEGHWDRPWRGIILGRRAPGCIKAYFVGIKLKLSRAPLIELITMCQECTELKLYDQLAQMDRILNFQGVPNTPGKKVFRVSHKEMEEIFFSKVMVLVGMFTTPFLTIGSDGQWKEWNIS
jgi:hypothetical protein